MSFILALFNHAQCVTLENDKILLKGNIYYNIDSFTIIKVSIQSINVKDEAAVCISNEKSDVKVDICSFDYITSMSGACCLWFMTKKADIKNVCSSNLSPQYSISSYKGGACLSLNDASLTSIDYVSISNVIHDYKNLYATIWFQSSTESSRNVNQTKCSCYDKDYYVCCHSYLSSNSNDKYIMISNSSGYQIDYYQDQKGSSFAEKFLFMNCDVAASIISFISGASLTMKDCIVKECKGTIFKRSSGTVSLSGWYSDTSLPAEFKNTTTKEFDIPISSAICKVAPGEELIERCAMKNIIYACITLYFSKDRSFYMLEDFINQRL